MKTKARAWGFTLLEMLVALALMSVIAGTLYASLYAGFHAQERAEARLAPLRRGQLAVELLRNDIEAALPPVGVLAAEFVGTDAVDEEGRDADTLVMHTSAHVQPAGRRKEQAAAVASSARLGGIEKACDIRRVELALASSEDGGAPALVRFITTQLLAPETPEPDEQVLCRRVRGFNLRYFDGADWLDAWDSTAQDNALPLAVEVTLTLVPDEDATVVAAAGEDVPATHVFSRIFTIPTGGAPAEGETTIIRR